MQHASARLVLATTTVPNSPGTGSCPRLKGTVSDTNLYDEADEGI